jgi:hypothetical protein
MSTGCRKGDVLVCGTAVLVACLLVHTEALEGFFLADDYTIIASFWGKGFPHLLRLLASDEIGGVWNEQFVRPVRSWSLAMDGVLWGLRPFGFHLTNLLLHAFVSAIVGGLVLRLQGDLLPALLASLLFLLHPFNVEVATWITGRDESLCAAALLGAFGCYLAWQDSGRKRLARNASLALFAASLFTKEYGLLFPLVLWLWGMVRFRPLLSSIRSSLPYLGVVALFLGLRWIAIGHPLAGYGRSAEGHSTLSLELLLQSVAGFLRDLWAPAAHHPWAAGVGALVLILLVARLGTGSPRELALIGYWLALWPLVFLLPTHNLIYTARHLYISFAGLSIGFGLSLARVRGRWKTPLTLAVVVSLAALLVAPTMSRVEEFTRMSNRCRGALDSIESLAGRASSDDVLVLVNMPAHVIAPYGFGWSLDDALRPPFSRAATDARLEVIRRRTWRSDSWAAWRRSYPNRGVHVLAWNPAFNGIEILREGPPAPMAASPRAPMTASRH